MLILYAAKKTIVEIDGGQHMNAVEYDLLRTKKLESYGYKVLRIWNHEVFLTIQDVMNKF